MSHLARERAPGDARFAWLGADAAPASAPAAGGPQSVEYDDVVPARAGGAAPPSDERLGTAVELQPTMDELEHKARRDRLLRRVFWLLFAVVLAYLVGLWWF